MVSPVSYLRSATKGDLIVISLLAAAINQLGIHLLKTKAIGAINNCPIVQTNNQKSIEEAQQNNKKRNTAIVAIIERYNMYKLSSVIISCAIGAFCLYKKLSPLSYLAPLGMYIDWKKFAHNRDVIAQLKTPPLTNKFVGTLDFPAMVTISVNKSSFIQMIRHIFMPENNTTCEDTTDKQGVRFVNKKTYNTQSTEIGCYPLN